MLSFLEEGCVCVKLINFYKHYFPHFKGVQSGLC